MNTPETTPRSRQFMQSAVSDFINRNWRGYLLLFAVAGVIVALDQWTKALVRANIPLGGDWLPASMTWLLPYARVRYWYNTGAAFGLFQSGSLIFMILAVIVSGLIIYYFPRVSPKDWWLRLAMGMQLGGAIGNLIDRLIFHGRVTDFISIGNFAVFNLADSSISVGVAVLVLGAWIKEGQIKKAAGRTAPNPDGTPGPSQGQEASSTSREGKAKGE